MHLPNDGWLVPTWQYQSPLEWDMALKLLKSSHPIIDYVAKFASWFEHMTRRPDDGTRLTETQYQNVSILDFIGTKDDGGGGDI